MINRLTNTLKQIGRPTEVYRSPDGTRVLILPHGGRILGLFAPHSDENFFWTHPALASVESARAFYESGQWQNSGGDRTWLAPEVDFFFPNFPKLDKYWQQRQLDPGNYKLIRRGTVVKLANSTTLSLSRFKQKVRVKISKWVSPAPNPVRHERGVGGQAGIEYAGYTLHTSLEFFGVGKKSSACVGLWNLLQLPHGGELLVPTYFRAEPKVYMGNIGLQDLIVTEHLVRYKMRALGEHKIGIRAVATAGRAGYAYPMRDQFALVVRNFSVNPSGEYVDVPWTETENLGYSTQACNVNGPLGSFSELEYHVPAIGGETGLCRSDDTSEIWAFRGPQDRIQATARRLLSGEI